MQRSASQSSRRSAALPMGAGGHLPSRGVGPYALVDQSEVTDPLLQDAIEQEEAAEPDAAEADELAWLQALPWYRRPHPAWLYPLTLVFALAGGILLAPRMEMYLSLLCDEMGIERGPSSSGKAHIPSQACRQSPAAQRQLSMLQLLMLITNGVGCAFSAGFWSRMSDRKGRTRMMMVNVFGIFVMDVIVLIASTVPLHQLPFGVYFFAIGSTIEGLLGGYSAVNAMSQCYISDVTPSGSRARLFALMSGVLFAGVAIGPTIGGLLTVATGDVTATLWIATVLHGGIVAFLPFFPESLNKARQRAAEEDHKEAERSAPDVSWTERLRTAALAPLNSLRIIMPERAHEGYTAVPGDEHSAPDEHISVPCKHPSGSWDINMLLVSIAYFLESATIAIVPTKIQYVQLVFNWDSEMLGFFMSFTALTRMLMLVVCIPLFIRFVHRPLASIALPQDAQIEAHVDVPTELDADGRAVPTNPPRPWTASDRRVEQQWAQRAKLMRLIHDSRMDVRTPAHPDAYRDRLVPHHRLWLCHYSDLAERVAFLFCHLCHLDRRRGRLSRHVARPRADPQPQRGRAPVWRMGRAQHRLELDRGPFSVYLYF